MIFTVRTQQGSSRFTLSLFKKFERMWVCKFSFSLETNLYSDRQLYIVLFSSSATYEDIPFTKPFKHEQGLVWQRHPGWQWELLTYLQDRTAGCIHLEDGLLCTAGGAGQTAEAWTSPGVAQLLTLAWALAGSGA